MGANRLASHVDSFWKWPIILLILGLIAFAGARIVQIHFNSDINSFEDCVSAGHPILESFPEQCVANGRNFVRTLEPEN